MSAGRPSRRAQDAATLRAAITTALETLKAAETRAERAHPGVEEAYLREAHRAGAFSVALENLIAAAEPLAAPAPKPRVAHGRGSRSAQARRLAADLSATAGVRVELVFDTGATWRVTWTDGPAWTTLRVLVAEALATGAYPDLVNRILAPTRSTTERAWAARAVAARRTGALDEVIATARHVDLGPTHANSPLTDAHFAVLAHMRWRLESTDHPDRADEVGDEPVIAELLGGTGSAQRSEYKMTDVLLAARRAPTPTPDGPALRLVDRDDEEDRT